MKTKDIKISNTRRRAAKNNFIKIMKMEGGAQSQKHNVSGQIRKPFSSPVESHDSTCRKHGENTEFMSYKCGLKQLQIVIIKYCWPSS